MARKKELIIVDSKVFPLEVLFLEKFVVDFYQREYVWERKQLEDLIIDLSSEFLKNWEEGHTSENVEYYDPYFMGEIVLSMKNGEKSAVIDGQQRITTLTLLLIYLLRTYGHLPDFPSSELEKLIYGRRYGKFNFNLDIEERNECMESLFKNGDYTLPANASPSVINLVNRYNDISDSWNKNIDDHNVVPFTYWIMGKVMFSKVWTNSDEFAYVIFETMNDRGLSLTQIEMLRSYLLAHIDESARDSAMEKFDTVIRKLSQIKLSSKSKAEFEFFKMYFRGHFAEDLSQSNSLSDFVRIGKEFHRWVSDNTDLLKLKKSADYVEFIDKIEYFANVYIKINDLIQERNTNEYLYLIVNNDYAFTMQPAAIMAAVAYKDSDATVLEKTKVVSKYITKALTWRVWNHWMISQSALEDKTYNLCKNIRDKSVDEIRSYLLTDPFESPKLDGMPILNQQNKSKFKVMLSLITEIVGSKSKEPDYPLNHPDIEVEHIWANHYDWHVGEFKDEAEFSSTRNTLGDLLVLPKSFNASYGDDKYEDKVIQYFSQNILAQTLNAQKYTSNPGFLAYKNVSALDFKPYTTFTKDSITERTMLYKAILEDNWK